MKPNRFTAYRIYTATQERSHYHRNLTLEQARNKHLFPLGPQTDSLGRIYVWSYGINNGVKV